MDKNLLLQAIDKLDRETEQQNGKTNEGAIRQLETMMRAVCENSEAACRAVLAEDKTLEGAYKAMYEAAKERRGGSSCVCIGPEEASRIVLDYYGIDGEAGMDSEEPKSQTSADMPEAAPEVVDLFDLL